MNVEKKINKIVALVLMKTNGPLMMNYKTYKKYYVFVIRITFSIKKIMPFKKNIIEIGLKLRKMGKFCRTVGYQNGQHNGRQNGT